jgi:hypothetical protein
VFCLYGYLIRLWHRGSPLDDGINLEKIQRELRADPLAMILLGTMALVALGAALIGYAALPNNWDTLAYRFSRVYFYLSSGALSHPAAGFDPRANFYPFNGSILYLFLAQYQLTGVIFNFVSFAAWSALGVAGFYFTLIAGASVRAAIATTLLVTTTPGVLCGANSTTDEVIAAAPLLMSFVFGVLWVRFRSNTGLFLSALSLSICLGVKNHWLFLTGFGSLVLLLAATRWRAEVSNLLSATVNRRLIACTVLLSAPLVTAYLAVNYVSSGKLGEVEFTRNVINVPFSWEVAKQGTKLYTAQLLLTPLVDHTFLLGRDIAREAIRWANEATGPFLTNGLKQEFPFTHRFYTFRGLYPPDGEVYYEQTIWAGLMPYLLLVGGVLYLVVKPIRNRFCWFMLLLFPLWHLAFSFLHRYAETVCSYYVYVSPLAFVTLGVIWDQTRSAPQRTARILSKMFPAVIVSNLLLAGVLFAMSAKRDISLAWTSSDGETAVSRVEGPVRNVITASKKVYFPYNHWELLYWNIMRLNPSALYFTGDYKPETGYDLILKSYPGMYSWSGYVPIRAAGVGGYRFAGVNGSSDYLLCSAPTCWERCRRCEEFVALPFSQEVKDGRFILRATGGADGLNPGSVGRVRAVFYRSGDRTQLAGEWFSLEKVGELRAEAPTGQFEFVQFQVQCMGQLPRSLSRTSVPLQVNGRLPMDELREPDLEEWSSSASNLNAQPVRDQ